VRTDRRRRPNPPPRAPTLAATIAMFHPEMATTWLAPTVVNAAARSRSTRSRSPTRMPAASPASGSGIARISAAEAARRQRSGSYGLASGALASSVRDRSVPATPIRRR
jgi:hypothetical protein